MTSPAAATDLVDICALDAVPRGGGVAALVHGVQVAVLRSDDGQVFALDNRDPFTGAHVLARGIVGTHGGVATVASPLRKQRFALATGRCLDDDTVTVPTYVVEISDDRVHVALTLSVASDAPETSA